MAQNSEQFSLGKLFAKISVCAITIFLLLPFIEVTTNHPVVLLFLGVILYYVADIAQSLETMNLKSNKGEIEELLEEVS